MCLTADGLRQLREIINADEWDEYLSDVYHPMSYVPSSTTSEASAPVTRRKRSSAELEELASEARFCKPKARSATGLQQFSICIILLVYNLNKLKNIIQFDYTKAQTQSTDIGQTLKLRKSSQVSNT